MQTKPIDKEELIQSHVAVVVIGRNEGARLSRCLKSAETAAELFYVDSGSSDDSVARVEQSGAVVINLDMSKPFTAGRARNAGFQSLVERAPDMRYVQFVDGDCELHHDWIDTAYQYLQSNHDVAAICGALLERNPAASLYTCLCSLEWRAPPGDAEACGGIFMIRREAFAEIQGFNESLIAGEEPEMFYRLRKRGWRIVRLPDTMATHDAAMTRFSQWWRRTVRSGHAYAERAWLHRAEADRPWRREVLRDWFWAALVPLIAIGASVPTGGLSLSLLLLYPVSMWKTYTFRRRSFDEAPADAWLYAFFCVLGKLPSALGQLLYHRRRMRGKAGTLIEYKMHPIDAREGRNSSKR